MEAQLIPDTHTPRVAQPSPPLTIALSAPLVVLVAVCVAFFKSCFTARQNSNTRTAEAAPPQPAAADDGNGGNPQVGDQTTAWVLFAKSCRETQHESNADRQGVLWRETLSQEGRDWWAMQAARLNTFHPHHHTWIDRKDVGFDCFRVVCEGITSERTCRSSARSRQQCSCKGGGR